MGTILGKRGGGKFDNGEIPTFKIVLVGDPGAGKSSVFLRYTKNQFDYSYQPSVSISIGNVVKKINIPYQGVVSVVIWDVPGREEMDLRKSYYKDVDAAIVVVDVSERDAIELAPTWKQDVLNHAQTTTAKNGGNQEIPVLLLGNKVDKLHIAEGDERISSSSQSDKMNESKELQILEETAVTRGFVGSVAVSAKEGDGSVQAAIQTLVRYLLQKRLPVDKIQKDVDFFKSNTTSGDKCDSEITFMPFLKVHIKEFDDIFDASEEPMKVTEKCGQDYAEALRLLRKACCIADLTHSYKSSLEECITGLKQCIVEDKDKRVLQAVDDGGFLNLVVMEDYIDDISGPINKILRIFHTKVAVAAKKVLAKCPIAHNELQQAEQKLDAPLASFDHLAKTAGLSAKARRKARIDVEANRTRITESCATAVELLRNVDADCKKIRAAVLW